MRNLIASRDFAFVINGVGNIASPVSMLVASVLLARELSVAGRGESAAIIAPFLLLIAVGGFGLPDSVVYYFSSNRPNRRGLMLKVCVITLATGLVTTFLLSLLSGPLSGGDPEIRSGIDAVNLLIVPMLLLTILRSVAAGKDDWTVIAGEKIIGGGARVIALIYLATVGHFTPLSAAWSIAGGSLVGVVAYVRIWKGPTVAVERSAPPADSAVSVKELVSFSGRVWLGSVAGVLLMRVDQLLILPLSSAVQLGLYVVAVNCAEVLLVVINTVREVVFARASSVRDITATVDLARKLNLWMLGASAAYGCSLYIWFDWVFGSDYFQAIGISILMIFAVWVGIPGSIAGAVLAGRGSPGARSVSLLVAFAVNTILVILLVPFLGAWGAAVATLVGNVVSGSMNIIFAGRRFGLKPRSFYISD